MLIYCFTAYIQLENFSETIQKSKPVSGLE
jgi:hypothetical protein